MENIRYLFALASAQWTFLHATKAKAPRQLATKKLLEISTDNSAPVFEFIKVIANHFQFIRETVMAFLFQILRNTVEAFCDTACDAGQGVAGATEGYI